MMSLEIRTVCAWHSLAGIKVMPTIRFLLFHHILIREEAGDDGEGGHCTQGI